MFNRIFPRYFNNHFPGHVVALWLFVPVIGGKILLSLFYVFAADGNAAIALNSSQDNGLLATRALFAHMGAVQLLFGLLCVTVLFRYRSMIPLMYLFMLLNYCVEDWIPSLELTALNNLVGSPLLTQGLLMATVFGFVLSLYRYPNEGLARASNQTKSLKI